MNWDRIEGNWKQIKGRVKEQWGKLTMTTSSHRRQRDQLVGKIQETYGSPRRRPRSRSNSSAAHFATQTAQLPMRTRDEDSETDDRAAGGCRLTAVGGAWARRATRTRGTRPCAAPKRNTSRPRRRVMRFRQCQGHLHRRRQATKGSPRPKPRLPTKTRQGRARRSAWPEPKRHTRWQGEVRRPVRHPKDICVKEAKAAHVKALADARVDRVARTNAARGRTRRWRPGARLPRTSGTPITASRSRSATRSRCRQGQLRP